MPKIKYRDINFKPDSLLVIERTNQIITNYQAQGFTLTVRQAYYQHVARGWIANNEQSYKRLGSIINDARIAGLIDWDALEDRTRMLRGLTHWNSPAEIMSAVGSSYRKDMWANQPYRPEVWIEKDALIGVIEGVCNELDVDYFSCRGYTSQSEMWGASQRLERYTEEGQTPVLLHLGDHDPSGIDMSRDIRDRLDFFMGGVEFERLALNMDQVQQYSPPPNPAKLSDSRAVGYIKIHGDESWELDALEPTVLAQLIRDAVNRVRDNDLWLTREIEILSEKRLLDAASRRWNEVVTLLGGSTRASTTDKVGPRQKVMFVCEWCEYEFDESELKECEGCHQFYCSDHLPMEEHGCDGYVREDEGDAEDPD